MRVLVTRPQPQADAWVQRLRAAGADAVALPLLGIDEAPDSSVLTQAWQVLADARPDAWPALVVFVSPNAVDAFFHGAPPVPCWPTPVLAGAPGPGTAAALRARGVAASAVIEPAADSAQFDADALWARLRERPWTGRAVWIVRGDGGREWLADRLRAAGAKVRHLQAYRRAAPALDAVARGALGAAIERPADHVWLFSSSQAIAELDTLAPGTDWSGAQALATHPRIAASARAAGFGSVEEVRPPFDAVCHALRRLGVPCGAGASAHERGD